MMIEKFWIFFFICKFQIVIIYWIAVTAERFFRIDRAQEELYYVVDICHEDLFILDPQFDEKDDLDLFTSEEVIAKVVAGVSSSASASSSPTPSPLAIESLLANQNIEQSPSSTTKTNSSAFILPEVILIETKFVGVFISHVSLCVCVCGCFCFEPVAILLQNKSPDRKKKCSYTTHTHVFRFFSITFFYQIRLICIIFEYMCDWFH